MDTDIKQFAKFYQTRIDEKLSYAVDFFQDLRDGKADIDTTEDEIQSLLTLLRLDWEEVEEGSRTLEDLMNA